MDLGNRNILKPTQPTFSPPFHTAMANMMTVGDMRKGEDDDEDKEKFYAGGAGKHGGRYDCDLIHCGSLWNFEASRCR